MTDETTQEGGAAAVVETTTTVENGSIAAANEGTNTAEQKNDTILAAVNKEAVTEEVKAPTDFPENWRELYAKEDAKTLERLKRFASPQAAFDALIEAQNKIRSGQIPKGLPENATDEEKSEWRKAQGIPDKPADYDLSLPDGLIIGEQDKPLVGKFVEALHGQNLTQDQMKAALSTYYQIQAEQEAEISGRVEADKTLNLTELKSEWGGKFQGNINIVSNYLKAQFGEEAAGIIGSAYDGNGMPLANNAKVLRRFLAIAMDHDPVATITPASGLSGLDGVVEEIGALEKRMATDPSWHKDTKANERYMQLVAARDKVSLSA